jgi:hypothetical protein
VVSTIVNQNGAASPLPATNVGWDQETELATATRTATSNTAGTGGRAVAVSNSYGGGEAGSSSLCASYTHTGTTITASSGDSGFAGGPQFPATCTGVLAIGGTSVHVGGTPRDQ